MTMDEAIFALVIASFILLIKSVPLLTWRTISILSQWYIIKVKCEGGSILKHAEDAPLIGPMVNNIVAVADNRENLPKSIEVLVEYIKRSTGLYGESVVASIILLTFISGGVFDSTLSTVIMIISILAIILTIVSYIITIHVASIVNKMVEEIPVKQ